MSKKIVLLDDRFLREKDRVKIERMVNSVDVSVILSAFPTTDPSIIKVIDLGKT